MQRPIRHDLAVLGAVDLFGEVTERTLLTWYPGSNPIDFWNPVLELVRKGYMTVAGTPDGDLLYKLSKRAVNV